jgi:hypothetical protein
MAIVNGSGDPHRLLELTGMDGIIEISDLAREPADRPPVGRELLVDGALR